MGSSVLKLLVSRLIGFIIFLLLMIALNILVTYTSVPIFTEFVGFLTDRLVFISWIALFLIIGELFVLFKYPFNIPYPLFNATGALLVTYFFADFFMFLMSYSSIQPDFPFDTVFLIAGILIFFIVVIVGYYKIFKNVPEEWKVKPKIKEKKEAKAEEEAEEAEEETKEPEEKPKKKTKKKTKSKAKTTKKTTRKKK